MYIYYNANPEGKSTGDCVIRAIATITGKSWDEVYDEMYLMGKYRHQMMDDNSVWHEYLYHLGFEIHPIHSHTTINKFCYQHPIGEYLLGTGKHLVAAINGDYLDAWDSGNEVPVFYWQKGEMNAY